jgi:hypothetical protein
MKLPSPEWVSLHRSQILRDLCPESGSTELAEVLRANSGILLLRRKIPLLFAEKDLKTVCFAPFLLSHESAGICDRYLARNSGVAANLA